MGVPGFGTSFTSWILLFFADVLGLGLLISWFNLLFLIKFERWASLLSLISWFLVLDGIFGLAVWVTQTDDSNCLWWRFKVGPSGWPWSVDSFFCPWWRFRLSRLGHRWFTLSFIFLDGVLGLALLADLDQLIHTYCHWWRFRAGTSGWPWSADSHYSHW